MRKCKQCGSPYTPTYTTTQKVCGPTCALAYNRELDRKAQERRWKQEHAARRELIKTKRQWAAEAQEAFNRWVRERDYDLPCISCSQPASIGQRHASHYRSRAAASQLRYNAWNCNASCAQCNSMKSGNIVEYRIGLVRKIGLERVEALENNSTKSDYTIDYLKRVKRIFNKRANMLKKRRESIDL